MRLLKLRRLELWWWSDIWSFWWIRYSDEWTCGLRHLEIVWKTRG